MRYIHILICLSAMLWTSPIFAQDFTLTSNSIVEGSKLSNDQVFQGFGCEGKNLSPHLAWNNIPEGTKSFAITAFDPDAPTQSGWWHWNVVNIPITINELSEGSSNSLNKGFTELKNDFGKKGFGGACPPPNEVHRYIFTIYALKVSSLDITPDTSNALASFLINANTISKSHITAVYKR